MKRTLLLALAILFAATVANASYPYVMVSGGVIDPETGIEGPGGYDHSNSYVFVPAPYVDIEVWIWWSPNPLLGLRTVEFKISYPTSTYVIPLAVTPNPLIVDEIGTIQDGIISTIGIDRCETDWFWSHHQRVTVRKVTSCGYVVIQADPNRTIPPYAVVLGSCEPESPAYECQRICDGLFGINTINYCGDAVNDKTWGAIKSLYTD